MYIGVHKPKSNVAGGNKGSSSTLMEYLAKEDVEILDHFSEEFLKNNEGTLEALLFEQKEYEESIKELQKSIKNNTDVEIEDLNNQEYLLLHYSEKLKEINNKIESHNEDFITFSSQNIENYSEEDLQLNLSSIQEINEKKNELLNSVEIIKNELEKLNSNNEYEFINLHNQLENYNQELENLNSQILEYEYQRDQINLQLEDKTRTFFTSDFSNCTKEEATEIIDKQSKGLEKNDSKYFMLSIDPSEKEIKHLLSDIVPDVEAVKSHKDLTSLEQKQLNDKLKDYTHLVMEEYAKEFDRTKKNGAKLDRNDLVYVAKIENERKYSHTDKDVIFNRDIDREIRKVESGSASSREKELQIKELKDQYKLTPSGKVIKENVQKEGFQSHVHIVVSRYDKGKEMKLSPLANSKGQNDHKLDGREVQIGFNRTNFAISCQERFDEKFQYQRPDKDKTSVMIQDNRNQNSNGLNDLRKVVNKEGKVDTLEAIKVYASGIKGVAELALTGDIKKLDPSTLLKTFSNEISPTEKLQRIINEINPKAVATQKIKQAITKGGLEL